MHHALIRAAITCAATCILASTATSQTTAKGVVYHDLNNNQQRDPDEPGVANVRVSNEMDIVTTDADGRYSIPVDDETMLFVIKPRGYETPIDERGVYRFYYIHKPNGSSNELIFPGSEPTGPLPESVDFPLTKVEEPETFEVLLLGDPQPYTAEAVRMYADEILARASKVTDARFAIALGDIVGDDLDLFDPIIDAHAILGMPVRYVYGNHDMNTMATDDEDADETFERVFGPTDYGYQVGRVHFLMLDNVFWLGRGREPDGERDWVGYARQRRGGIPRIGGYKGTFTDDQLTFIENFVDSVPEGDLIVLNTHIPLFDNDPDSVHQVPQLERVMRVFADHGNTISFSGHTHVNRHFFFDPAHEHDHSHDHAHGHDHSHDHGDHSHPHHHYNVGTASGSWWNGLRDIDNAPHSVMRDGTPKGFAVATFDGADYSVVYYACDPSFGEDMRIVVPGEFEAGSMERMKVVANIWGVTGEKSTARMRLIGRNGESLNSWTPMAFAPQVDPAYAATVTREAELDLPGRSIPDAQTSYNIFEGAIDAVPTEPGMYAVEVEAQDMFGRTVTDRRHFLVMPATLLEVE